MKILRIFTILGLLLFIISCEDQIVSECDSPAGDGIPAKLSSIQAEVLSTDCATSGCHESGAQPPDLSLGNTHSSLVNVNATVSGKILVVPGNSSQSYLINKLTGENISGSRMPLAGSPLSPAIIDSIAAWIDAGALNN